MITDNITNGHGNTEELNQVADKNSKKTESFFKKEDRKSGYKPPKYESPNGRKKNGSSEGNPYSTKITHGVGYIKDFETWVKTKIAETKSENK